MRILLDEERCTGHGRCYALAPEVFGSDDVGHCEILRAGPTADQVRAARTAVASCPEDALTIEE